MIRDIQPNLVSQIVTHQPELDEHVDFFPPLPSDFVTATLPVIYIDNSTSRVPVMATSAPFFVSPSDVGCCRAFVMYLWCEASVGEGVTVAGHRGILGVGGGNTFYSLPTTQQEFVV